MIDHESDPTTLASHHPTRRDVVVAAVVVPLAVTFSTLAIVNTPPRGLPGGKVTLRNFQPLTPGMP